MSLVLREEQPDDVYIDFSTCPIDEIMPYNTR